MKYDIIELENIRELNKGSLLNLLDFYFLLISQDGLLWH
jgi:hypothetical protein